MWSYLLIATRSTEDEYFPKRNRFYTAWAMVPSRELVRQRFWPPCMRVGVKHMHVIELPRTTPASVDIDQIIAHRRWEMREWAKRDERERREMREAKSEKSVREERTWLGLATSVCLSDLSARSSPLVLFLESPLYSTSLLPNLNDKTRWSPSARSQFHRSLQIYTVCSCQLSEIISKKQKQVSKSAGCQLAVHTVIVIEDLTSTLSSRITTLLSIQNTILLHREEWSVTLWQTNRVMQCVLRVGVAWTLQLLPAVSMPLPSSGHGFHGE